MNTLNSPTNTTAASFGDQVLALLSDLEKRLLCLRQLQEGTAPPSASSGQAGPGFPVPAPGLCGASAQPGILALRSEIEAQRGWLHQRKRRLTALRRALKRQRAEQEKAAAEIARQGEALADRQLIMDSLENDRKYRGQGAENAQDTLDQAAAAGEGDVESLRCALIRQRRAVEQEAASLAERAAWVERRAEEIDTQERYLNQQRRAQQRMTQESEQGNA
jgi:chromosome segregation ATPase